MAVNSRAVSVGAAATRLDTEGETDSLAGSAVAVHNNGSSTIFVGAAGVTTATGFPLAAGTSMSCELYGNEAVYGIVASGTVEARVLEVGI